MNSSPGTLTFGRPAPGQPCPVSTYRLQMGPQLTFDEAAAVAPRVAALGVSQPTVSKHLKVLRDAGVLTMRAEGTRRLYAIDFEGPNLPRDHDARVRAVVSASAQHFLNFLPEPQGQGSLRPGSAALRTVSIGGV